MGRDKAILSHKGTTLAGSVADLLDNVTSPSVEVGPGVTGLPHVTEDPPGAGPLAGISAGWRALTEASGTGSSPFAGALVLACDLPLLNRQILDLLMSWPGDCSAVPVVGGRLQFLCARYSSTALESAGRLVTSGYSAVGQLALEGCADLIGPHTWAAAAGEQVFADLDVPDDLQLLDTDTDTDTGTGTGGAG